MTQSLRAAIAAVLVTGVLALTSGAPTFAQSNNGNQNGLANVNVSSVVANIPVSVALPVGLAANLCGINAAVLGAAQQNDPNYSCDASSNPSATSVAQALTTGAGGAGNNNGRQSGLINVNISNVLVNLPVSAAVPIGVAANACGINAAVIGSALQQDPNYTCTATSMPMGLAQALAGA